MWPKRVAATGWWHLERKTEADMATPTPLNMPMVDTGEQRRDTPAKFAAARIETLLAEGFPLMTFPTDLERQFQHDGSAARSRHFLVSGLIALLIYNGFLLVDYTMARDVFGLAVQLRLLVFTPISLLVLYRFWRETLPFFRPAPPSLVDLLALVGGLAAAASLAVILTLSRSPLIHFYHVGFMVVITYGNVVQRLRFWYAVLFTALLLGIHVTGLMSLPAMPARLLWPIFSMVMSVALFTLSTNYYLERDERRRYLMHLRERFLVRELTQAHGRLREAAHVDSLTGLHNRSFLRDRVEALWSNWQQEGITIGLMLMDVDHFKKFNDRYGPQEGDVCLQRVSEALRQGLRRRDDIAARLEGEEFIAVLPYTDLSMAIGTAERIRQNIEDLRIRHEGSSTALHLTVSIGVASVAASAGTSLESVIAVAEQALNQAKEEGRNRVCALQR